MTQDAGEKSGVSQQHVFHVVFVQKSATGVDGLTTVQCSKHATASDVLRAADPPIDPGTHRLRVARGPKKGWLQGKQVLSERSVDSGWKLRVLPKVNKEERYCSLVETST